MLGRLRPSGCAARIAVRPRSAAAASRSLSLSASPPPQVFETVGAYRAFRGALPHGASVGLVPTMGYLHDGHLALARRARHECDVVVATIFVNPTQFAAHEDLGTYPRDPERDLELLHGAGVDAVLLPTSDEIYGAGHTIAVEPGPDFSSLAEGAARGAHFFRGVATVVTKLFNITQPTCAYFGQKDAMQCVLIRKLVRELNFPTEVVVVPTQREPDGLAMSSRNVYLSPEERAAAPTLYRALSAIQAEYERAGGEPVAASQLVQSAMEVLDMEPLFTHVDYISIADPDSFQELTTVKSSGVAGDVANAAVVSAAVQIGKTRLLDNILL